MDTINNSLSIAVVISGLLGVIGAVYTFLRYTSYKTTVALQNDSIKALEDNNRIIKLELETSRLDHKRAVESIIALEKQVRTYKDLQLDKIAEALKSLATSSSEQTKSNQQILDTLKKSAVIANDEAHNDGLLVKTSERV